MKMKSAMACALLLFLLPSCSKPMADAKVAKDVEYVSRDYAADANDIYYAVRWALVECAYPLANENMQDGIITTAWVPITSNSHYVEIFGRRDFGVTNSYHQIEIQVVPEDGRTRVKSGSRFKTMVANMKSSGVEERKILDRIGDRLRKTEPEVTNLGIDE